MGATLSSDRRYVILVRHASRNFNSDHDESKQAMAGWNPSIDSVTPDYKVAGIPRTLAIANRLMDELGPIKVTHIYHSPHTVADQTAEVFRWAANARTKNDCSKEPVDFLEPDAATETMDTKSLRVYLGSDKLEDGSATIFVGHQPMLTFLARTLVKKLPVGTLPLGGSEVACLEMNSSQNASLLWLLTEKSSELMEDLKEKIRSKYDVAKFFLGAFVVNTGFVLSGEIWSVSNPLSIGLVFGGLILTLVALALTAATLISYDALLMPTDFWTGSSADNHGDHQIPRPKSWSVMRPPSQAQIVLFYEMVHVWTVFFIPALACAFAAIATFLVALAHNSLYSGIRSEGHNGLGLVPLIVIAVFAVGALTLPLVFHYRQKRPNLGFED